MPKSKTAAFALPLFVTVAALPGASVLTLPTLTVAAAPSVPFAPLVLPLYSHVEVAEVTSVHSYTSLVFVLKYTSPTSEASRSSSSVEV